MPNPIIHYQSFLSEAISLTVTSEASGYPIEYAADRRLSFVWKPAGAGVQLIKCILSAAKPANALGIIGHNLGTRGTHVRVQHAALSNFAGATTVLSETITSDYPVFLEFDAAGSDLAWRIYLSDSSGVPYIGSLLLGKYLTMENQAKESGSDWDEQRADNKTFSSQSGQKTGVQVSHFDRNIHDTFGDMTEAYVMSDLLTFVEDYYLPGLEFQYMPDTVGLPNRAYYLSAPDNARNSMPGEANLRSWQLNASGIRRSKFR